MLSELEDDEDNKQVFSCENECARTQEYKPKLKRSFSESYKDSLKPIVKRINRSNTSYGEKLGR